MLRSAAHETYHFVENYSAKDAADLRDYVIDALKGNGVDIEKALEKYAKQGYATRDEQISELVADSMFDVFSNEDFIKNLTAKNQTLAKRLANHIGELVNKIREAVKMLSVRYSNPEIKALMDDAEKLDTIRNMLLEGYKNAGENFKAEQAEGQKNNAVVINVKYSLSSNARKELHKALYDKTYNQEVLLRDETPTIMLGHNGVKNHPMVMKVSHIRENVFTEKEAKKLGLKIDSKTHYHGLGEDFFLDVIDSLDNVKEAYRGTKIATDTSRRENYFLLVTEFQDKNGNTINVPVYINADAQVNRVFFKTNKIATVFGRDDFRIYINRQIKEKNLVKIKNRNSNPSEADTPLMPTYKETASKNSIPKTIKSVKQNLNESDAEYKQKQLDIINETNPAPNTYSTWIRSVDDIKTLSETLEDDDWEDEVINPDLTRTDIQTAIESGEITVYSSYPIKNGVFVSPSRMEAESYSGNGNVYEKTVDINDVAWIDPTQGQYAKPDAVYSKKQKDFRMMS